MLRLIGTDGRRLYAFDLPPGTLKVGRSPDQPIHVPDRTVSRAHAEIEIGNNGSEIYVKDLGSHNGTTVNGVKVTDRKQVKIGDKIMFGRTEFKIREELGETRSPTQPTSAVLAPSDPEKSVVLSLNEALQVLPSKVSDIPSLFPTLSEMARILILPEPKEVMLERALTLVNRVIPGERLAILMTKEQEDDVYVSASLLPSGKDPGNFTLSRTIVNEIITKKNSVLLGDPKNDPRYAAQHSIIISEIRSAMAVPLFDEDNVLGILYVDTTNPLHRYNNDYLRLLATFGNIIASRLLNYSLITERQEKQIYEAELSRASLIQQKLLIRDKPDIPGYKLHAFQRQCRAVGGDLYDFACLPDGKLVVIVADVSGKGMGAALLMSNILASFRIMYNVTEFSLDEVVKMVSLQLYYSSDPADFATLFVGVLDPTDHLFTYINAGHNPPLIARSGGGFDKLEPNGIMIGAFDFGDWAAAQTTLGPDETLLVFTDGVTEAESGEGQYGEPRIEEEFVQSCSLDPTKLLEHLVGDIESFVQDYPQSDDITILALKRIS